MKVELDNIRIGMTFPLDNIHVGILNKEKTDFEESIDLTNDFIGALIEWCPPKYERVFTSHQLKQKFKVVIQELDYNESVETFNSNSTKKS